MGKNRLKIGDNAPEIIVRDPKGTEITLDQEFWKEGPVLLSFLRHFG